MAAYVADHRLFAPLAWTKTYSLVASLIVAVLLVPPLARILLKNSQKKNWSATYAAILFGGLVAALLTFVWQDSLRLVCDQMLFTVTSVWADGLGLSELPEVSVPTFWVILLVSLLSGGLVYLALRERLRPVDQNLVAKTVNFFYEPTLRLFLRFKRAFLMIPALLILFGMAAWVGFPTLLKPFESVSQSLGADFNRWQPYVDFKHTLRGLESDDWIALDEGSWFYMPSLYPAASLSQAMETLQTQDAMIKNIWEVENVLGKIGRVESALDPAPAAMIETYVMLKPRRPK